MAIFARKHQQLSEQPSSRRLEEVGVAGNVVFSGFDGEEKRADSVSIQTYRDMLDKDTTVEALFNVFTLPIIATNYKINADENDAKEEQAEFVRKCLFEPPHKGGMETPFSLFLDQLLLAAVDGFQLFERVYRLDDKSKYTLKKLAHRDSIGMTLKRDDHGGYNGVRQQVTYDGQYKDVVIPAYKTFLFTHNKARSFLYGRSMLTSLYPKYEKKRRLEYLDSIGLQSDAIKPKVLEKTTNSVIKDDSGEKSPVQKALAVLSKLGELKSAVALPYGYKVTALNTEGRSPHESIERQNSEMARAFLATVVLMGSQGKESNVGSYALSSNLSNTLMISIQSFMNKIEEHINQYLIAELIDLNFAQRHYPEFKFDDVTSETAQAISDAFGKLIEKDRISDEMAKGIEDAAANRLKIDLDAIKKQREEQAKKDKRSAASGTAESKKEGGPQLSDVSSRDFPGLYDGLVDENGLGCIMLDLQTFDVRPHVDGADADLYATDEAHSSGAVAETEAHVTLLHGLLQNGNTIKDKVDKVLDGLNIESVIINDVGSFEVEQDAPSVPIIAYVSSNGNHGLYYDGDKLKQAHDRLALLPHINTFGDYQPHVTLAYVKNDPDIVQKWVKALGDKLRGMRLGTTSINYGDLPEEDDNEGGAAGSGGKFLDQQLSEDRQWWRPLTSAEKTINFADLNSRMNAMEQRFVDDSAPLIKPFVADMVKRAIKSKPDDFTVELPTDYRDLVMDTVRSAYDYAKKGAADELGVESPATSKEAQDGMQQLTDFVVQKQQDDLKNSVRGELIKAARTNQLAEESATEEDRKPFGAVLEGLLGSWFAEKLKQTASALVSKGVNNGRGDILDAVAEDGDLFQYSSILDDKVCAMCADLDGKTVTRDVWRSTKWKPPLHFHCRCIWVLIRKMVAGKIDTALPDISVLPNEAGGKSGPLL